VYLLSKIRIAEISMAAPSGFDPQQKAFYIQNGSARFIPPTCPAENISLSFVRI
jgi:hypothetical protein